VLRELDAELASASEDTGETLVWTAADSELLTRVGEIQTQTSRGAAQGSAASEAGPR
jgi:hypothetical protein